MIRCRLDIIPGQLVDEFRTFLTSADAEELANLNDARNLLPYLNYFFTSDFPQGILSKCIQEYWYIDRERN
jgi:hypothetical protein